LRGFAAKMLDLPEPHAQDRGHCAHAHWYCFLHVFTAVTNRAHGVGEGDCPRGNVGRVLSQTMPRQISGLNSCFPENAKCGDGSSKNRGLSNFSQTKLFLRPLPAGLGKTIVEGLIGFFESLPGNRKVVGELATHANGLRSLSREQEGNYAGSAFRHFSATFSFSSNFCMR
jgi:hypothetical protein